MEKYAVIDLGTNTFHLLVVEITETEEYRELHRERRFIKLAEDGIEEIGAAPLRRALAAMRRFGVVLKELNVSAVRAYGTAALRTARNGATFIEQVTCETGIDIQLITGCEEAQLIYKGVRQAVPLCEGYDLIMDIGGGSVEFIVANEEAVFWAQSFPIGVAVLHRKFHTSEPIGAGEVGELKAYLDETLQPLAEVLDNIRVGRLIGASGTFDVLENKLEFVRREALYSILSVRDFDVLCARLLPMNLEERLLEKGIPEERVELLVVALLLIDAILRRINVEQIVVSSYAMKEGILYDMLESDVKI